MSYHSIRTYEGNGGTGPYAVPPYISKSHIKVYVGDVLKTEGTDYTWPTTGNIQFVSSVASGADIAIRRVTKPDDRLVKWANAGAVTKANQDLADTQLMYLIQELIDALAVNAATDGSGGVGLPGTGTGGTGSGGSGVTPPGPDAGEGGSITPVEELPESGEEGQVVLLVDDEQFYIFHNGEWVPTGVTSITPAAPPSIAIVDELPADGEDGHFVFFEDELWIWTNGAWGRAVPSALVDPAVLYMDALPATADEGTVVLLTTDNKLYQRTSGAWVEMVVVQNVMEEVADASITVAKFAAGLRPVEVVSALPSSGNFNGRVVFLTTDSKLYRHNGTAFVAGIAAADLSGQVGSTQIADGAIVTDKLAANAITAGKIEVGAIGTNQLAADAVTASKIAAESITTPKLAASAVSADKVAANAITSDKLAANSVTAGKLDAGAVTADKLAANSVTAEKLNAGAVTADKLAANSVTAGKISAGAIGTSQLQANAVTADKIAAGSISVGSIQSGSSGNFNGVNWTIGIGATLAGLTAGASFVSPSSAKFGFIAANTGGGTGAAFGGTGFSGVAAQAVGGANNDFSTYTTIAALGNQDWAGWFRYGSFPGAATKSIQLATPSFAYITGGGAGGTFTGAHDGLWPMVQKLPEVGDILVHTGMAVKRSVYDTIGYVAISSKPNQKGVIGVFAEVTVGHVPPTMSKVTSVPVRNEKGRVVGYKDTLTVDPQFKPLLDEHHVVVVNALGEGLINVCGLGGDIEMGDLITTSSMAGKGMKQADDVMRSYTVAKATEAVTFSSPAEVKQIACTYHAG
jgi:hypothetical protein